MIIPEEVTDRLGVLGDPLVRPARKAVVADRDAVSCVQVPQLKSGSVVVLQGCLLDESHLQTAILFTAHCRPVAGTFVLRGWINKRS